MQPKHDPITTACIWFIRNRARIAEWVKSEPVHQGVTYREAASDSLGFVESVDQWVERWRKLYKQGIRKDWLCERYLVLPLKKVKNALEEEGSE